MKLSVVIYSHGAVSLVIACLVTKLRASAKFRSTSAVNGSGNVKDGPLSRSKASDESNAEMESTINKTKTRKAEVRSCPAGKSRFYDL